jgi:hypothetical protein
MYIKSQAVLDTLIFNLINSLIYEFFKLKRCKDIKGTLYVCYKGLNFF